MRGGSPDPPRGIALSNTSMPFSYAVGQETHRAKL
jgi:hypothetical protein